MTPELGVIEGRFGRSWSWDERRAVIATLAPAGYRFYHYGPKADAHLRRQWRAEHPAEAAAELADTSAHCRANGLRFGVVLTPMDVHHPVDDDARQALASRLAELARLGLDDLVLSFDDLRGDVPGLARAQADIVHFAAERARVSRLYFCPTYYSDDPVLDRVFGARPPDYLHELGRTLDPAVQIYWTGEEVCAREFRPGHLKAVADTLGRRVCLWDNYPVNDGPRMSQFLHLRAFTGRDPGCAPFLSGHAINPAIQPTLSCIPALTLPESYRRGEDYSYGAAFRDAANRVVGEPLASMLTADLMAFNDSGFHRLSEQRRASLSERYAAIDHPAAREVLGWLSGGDLMTDEEIRTQ